MKILFSVILSLIFLVFWSCSDSGEPILKGCMDMDACNDNPDASEDDGSCTYAEPNYDCDGNCIAGEDCAGVCGGSAAVDECGICNGPGSIYECGCADILEGDCDCLGNALDACGVCGGNGVNSDGICDDLDDCIGTYDVCGICNGPGSIYECGCADIPEGDCDCLGNALDECGICGGGGIADGKCDCDGNVLDDCGKCGGDNSSCVNYFTEIQPIFTDNCTSCHGSSGGLSLTSYSDLMGNDVVDPGNSMTSILIQRLKGTSGTQMPKNQDPLGEATINLIETWIDEGALDN